MNEITNAAVEKLQQLPASELEGLSHCVDSLCADLFAPEIAQWISHAIDAEHQRRYTQHKHHYPGLSFYEWSDREVATNMAFCLSVARMAGQCMSKQGQDFCWELLNHVANRLAEIALGVNA